MNVTENQPRSIWSGDGPLQGSSSRDSARRAGGSCVSANSAAPRRLERDLAAAGGVRCVLCTPTLDAGQHVVPRPRHPRHDRAQRAARRDPACADVATDAQGRSEVCGFSITTTLSTALSTPAIGALGSFLTGLAPLFGSVNPDASGHLAIVIPRPAK
jgi:hypothetical protein